MDDRGEARLPLVGFRVLELGYGIAAPVAARNLAQLGADVIRVESARRPDSLRMGGAGWLPAQFDQSVRRDTIPALNFSSPEKRSIGLEIDGADGRAVFEQLVAASDVVVTNISEDALGELGIAYEDIRALKPDIVYLTLPAFGSEGPYRSYRTWGHNLSAASGIDHLLGWPDREPVQIGFAYPDFVSAQAATVAVLAALMRRDATGEGARIEVWQYAMALACLGPTVVAAELSGEAPRRAGQPRRRTGTARAVSRARSTTAGSRCRSRTTRCGKRCVEFQGWSRSASIHGSRRWRSGSSIRTSSTTWSPCGPVSAPTGRARPSCRPRASRRRQFSTRGTSSSTLSSPHASSSTRSRTRGFRATSCSARRFGSPKRRSDPSTPRPRSVSTRARCCVS